MATYDGTIATGTDDAFENSIGATTTNGTTINPDEDDEWGFWRWTGLEDLDGATITSATATFYFTSTTGDEPQHQFWGHDVDNSATATAGGGGGNNISSRTKTTASITWENTDLGASAGSTFSPPDLSAILQEMSDSGHLAAGVFSLLCASITGDASRDFQTGTYELSVPPDDPRADLSVVYTPAASGAVSLVNDRGINLLRGLVGR